jgi:hypothetical protein
MCVNVVELTYTLAQVVRDKFLAEQRAAEKKKKDEEKRIKQGRIEASKARYKLAQAARQAAKRAALEAQLKEMEEEEYDEEDERCALCSKQSCDAHNPLIFCEGSCGQVFHRLCVNLLKVPEGDWFCSSAGCQRGQQGQQALPETPHATETKKQTATAAVAIATCIVRHGYEGLEKENVSVCRPNVIPPARAMKRSHQSSSSSSMEHAHARTDKRRKMGDHTTQSLAHGRPPDGGTYSRSFAFPPYQGRPKGSFFPPSPNIAYDPSVVSVVSVPIPPEGCGPPPRIFMQQYMNSSRQNTNNIRPGNVLLLRQGQPRQGQPRQGQPRQGQPRQGQPKQMRPRLHRTSHPPTQSTRPVPPGGGGLEVWPGVRITSIKYDALLPP